MKFKITILLFIILTSQKSFAQKQPLLNDKPGTFEILSHTNFTLPNFGFTRAEMTANLQKITELIDPFRQNTLLKEPRCFEGKARIYNTNNCKEYGSYGVPSRISFEFCTWYSSNQGKMELATIEPPNRPYLECRTIEALKGDNSPSYQLYRFEESLNMNMIRSLVPLIGKR